MNRNRPAAERQAAPAVLMVRPAVFYRDPQTAGSNAFQRESKLSPEELLAQVQGEFDGAVSRLREAGVDVIVMEAPTGLDLPDALFPNNWFSTHADGTVVLYPMEAARRRAERRQEYLDALQQQYGFRISRLIDLSPLEQTGEYVEGTGSLVLDRERRIAYACLSSRSTPSGVSQACDRLGYTPWMFEATDAAGRPIYHTNVLMSVGSEVAIVCLEVVRQADDRRRLEQQLRDSGKQLVEISARQMECLAANALEVSTPDGAALAISTRAWASLQEDQQRTLSTHLHIARVEIDTIEEVGGGGIRCMLAGIHLPRADHFPE